MSISVKHFSWLAVLVASLLLSNLLNAKPVSNNKINKESFKQPAIVEADSMTYDDSGVVTAKGNVYIVQGERMLLSDELVYNKNEDTITANGNISILEPDGSVFFADSVILRDGLKLGVIQDFKARLKDETLIAANKATRKSETLTQFEEVIYSPCSVCKKDKKKKPLWQLKARKANINEENERVSYKHVFFDVKGVSVLYSPYFSHPTPDAKRKTGFLTPEYQNDDIFGTSITTPFYYNIAPQMDATITPTFTTKEGTILAGNFRHLTAFGEYQLGGSITYPEERNDAGEKIQGREIRGHVEGFGRFNLNDNFKVGFDAKRSSDDTYLERYEFGNEDVLTSLIYGEYIKDKNYASITGLSFQGLNENDDPGASPLVLPEVNYHWQKNTGYADSRFEVDFNGLVVSRDDGVNSRRASMQGKFVYPFKTKGGHLFEFSTLLRGDIYNVSDVEVAGVAQDFDGTKTRALYETQLNWSYPLVKSNNDRKILIEPIINLIASPYGGNPDEIPNEDSQDIEFSDENLFSNNHFNGYDLVENGPRSNYGIRAVIEDRKFGNLSFLFGQTYRLKANNNFGKNSGLSDNFSDYIGQFAYEKEDLFDFTYKFRLEQEDLTPARTQISTNLYFNPISFGLNYLFLDEDFVVDETSGSKRELALANAKLNINKNWDIEAQGHRDFNDGEWISTRLNLLYKGNCLDLNFSWNREFTRDRDIRPNNTFSVKLSLENLGY